MRRNKKTIWFWLLLAVVVVAAVVILFVLRHENRRQSEIRESSESVIEQTNTTGAAEMEANMDADGSIDTKAVVNYAEDAAALSRLGIYAPEKELDWNALHEQNPDIYAWIVVPDTDIDFPIVHHAMDNTYYLNYGLDASDNAPDFLYSEDYNSEDFTDFNTVLYGRSEEKDTGFDTVHVFEETGALEDDHFIYVYTKDGMLAYRIFAAYEFPAIHLLLNFDLTNEYVREQYLKEVASMDEAEAVSANIRHDIEVTARDRILTLSTCVPEGTEVSDHDKLYRFMVAGVLVYPEGETSDVG